MIWTQSHVTIERSIDPAEGVEPVIVMEPGSFFKGDVTIECKKQALQEARKYRTGLVLWINGSRKFGGKAFF